MEIKYIDKDTFDATYKENVRKVYRIALYYTKDHHAAEDITQNVFLKLDAHRDIVDLNKIDVWMNTVTKYTALNYIRHHCHEIDYPDEDIRFLIEESGHEESAETAFIKDCDIEMRRELIKTIYAELAKTNPRWYEAMMAVCVLNRPTEEVAKTMNLSIGALRIMLHRAKNWIRRKYQEQLDHLNEI